MNRARAGALKSINLTNCLRISIQAKIDNACINQPLFRCLFLQLLRRGGCGQKLGVVWSQELLLRLVIPDADFVTAGINHSSYCRHIRIIRPISMPCFNLNYPNRWISITWDNAFPLASQLHYPGSYFLCIRDNACV